MNIILDAMGGDYAPAEVVKGAVNALHKHTFKVILVGHQEQISAELKKYPIQPNIEVVHAEENIAMSEHPAQAIRQKKGASINVCMRLLKEGKGDAVVSAGNTGAVMASALINLGRIKGIERPAICSVFPTVKGRTVVLDLGANSENKPEHLVQFAYMGKAYMEKIIGIENPRVGLLNIGEEDEKGNEVYCTTNQLLRKETKLNFIGNIESKDILQNEAEVVVCDGFVGNAILKFAEGMMFSLKKMLKARITRSPLAILGSLLMIPALKELKKDLDYTEYGGAPLLGVNGIVIITHGRAKAKTITNALVAASNGVKNNLMEALNSIS